MRLAVAELLRSATALPALTLWQPWAHAVAVLGKDVENREKWQPPRSMMGRALAIHAGLTYDRGGANSIREALGCEVPGREGCAMGAVVAVAVLAGCVRDSRSRWARPEHFHWLLQGTVSLPKPVPCKGAQGLWQLPKGVLEQVRAQVLYREALARTALALSSTEGPPSGLQKAAAEAWAATRLSHRAWKKGSARGTGPARQTGTVRVRVSAGTDYLAALPPACRYCGKRKEACAACGTWWCSAPGHLLHRCEPGWPRCTHGEPYWATDTAKPVPPDCCLPPDWWGAQAQGAGAP